MNSAGGGGPFAYFALQIAPCGGLSISCIGFIYEKLTLLQPFHHSVRLWAPGNKELGYES